MLTFKDEDVKGPPAYRTRKRGVRISVTPFTSRTVKSGTEKSRSITTWVAASRNVPEGEYSMRTKPSARTVKRASPRVTTASGFAGARRSRGCSSVSPSSDISSSNMPFPPQAFCVLLYLVSQQVRKKSLLRHRN